MATTVDTAAAGDSARDERAVLIALAGAVGAGAVALPGSRVGIGWTVCALALLAVVLVARATRPASDVVPDAGSAAAATGAADRAWRTAAGAAALGLAVVPSVRASPPLAALCLIAAAVLTSYALVGGATWLGLVVAAIGLGPATVAGLGWTARRLPRVGRALLALAGGGILLVVFGSLFASADREFAMLTRDAMIRLSTVDMTRVVLGATLVGTAAVACAYHIRQGRPVTVQPLARPERGLGLEWVIPVALLDGLFAVFVAVQFRTLFAGKEYVLADGGPDYSVFARSGFTQLAAVTVLTLAVVAALTMLARRASTVDVVLIRVLGGVLCGLTLVVVASALTRLSLYTDAYGFTWTRLLGFTGEVWLGVVFVLLLVAGIRLRAEWLPRTTAAVGVAILVTLVAINPEALMARTALHRLGGPFAVDHQYVTSLSVDALDAVRDLPDGDVRTCLLDRYQAGLRQSEQWYTLNLSRERARAVLSDHRPEPNRCRPMQW